MFSYQHCVFESEDLLVKYHQNTAIVDGIIQEKEALGEYQANPDFKQQRLFNCWDSTAKIEDDANEKATEVVRAGAITDGMATAMLSESQLVHGSNITSTPKMFRDPQSKIHCPGLDILRKNPSLMPAADMTAPSEEVNEGEPGDGDGKSKPNKNKRGQPKPKPAPSANENRVPKVKTPEQEAKQVPSLIYSSIQYIGWFIWGDVPSQCIHLGAQRFLYFTLAGHSFFFQTRYRFHKQGWDMKLQGNGVSGYPVMYLYQLLFNS